MKKVSSVKNTTMLDAALAYAKRGWPVFPLFYVKADKTCSCNTRKEGGCVRVGKHPSTKNGVMAATTDEGQIKQWWTETPYANIGMATGGDAPFVVDIDVAGDKVGQASLTKLESQYGILPETLKLKTGSGGHHYYFNSMHDVVNSANRVGQHIDVRGRGGYVILPPSNHSSGGKYEWLNDTKIADMPAWLEAKCMGGKIELTDEDHLQKEISDEAKEEVKEKREREFDRLTIPKVEELLKHLDPECDRDDWWQVGAVIKNEVGEEGFEIWKRWSEQASGPKKADIKTLEKQWESFKDKGLRAGTMIKLAKEAGFRGFDKEMASGATFKDWCFAAGTKRFIDTVKLLEWDREQFDAMWAHKFDKGAASNHLLRTETFKRVANVTYWPEKPMLVNEFGQEKFNYWRPSGVVPMAGNVSKFVNHIKYLFPDPVEANILTSYLAFQVQRPGEKVHWAVLLEGAQGNGKSYFGHVMRAVLGSDNVKMLQNEELHETFTGWQKNKQFIVVEEMMARARLDLMNKLKPMITENWCTIREMYHPPYEQPNRFNFLFFSNHKDSLILDQGDRRYCILKIESPPHPDGIEGYYKPLFNDLKTNAPALLHYLLNYDLSNFEPKAHAPMTAGKQALILQSMLPIDTFIYERIRAEEWPFKWDIINPSLVVAVLQKFNIKAAPKDVSNALDRLGHINLGKRRLADDDNKMTLWAVRNHSVYESMNGGQLRQVWMQQLAKGDGESLTIGNPDEFDKKHGADNPVMKGEPM